MEQFTPLVIPRSHVHVDSNRRLCPSDGFSYPIFRLINKTTRVYLSEPFSLDNLITYRPFAVANSKGWFAAVRKIGDAQDIILSTLDELCKAIANASEDDKGFFFPQRDLSLDYGLPTILAFAHNDTRLIVGLDSGSIYTYDTAMLFSSGSDSVNPIRSCEPQGGALRQITPNPGLEPDLIDTIAVVRSDGSVQLVNSLLESLGGWSPRDSSAGSVVVSWSPRGKHLAIGLQSGDVLTFALNNKSTLSKHVPPAAEGRLVGLNWLSPGHSFRLTYAPQIENEGESVQQIVSFDTQSNALTVFDTVHPFTMGDRHQESHALILSHWDEDSVSESTKTLVVVGDRASVDLEILGGHSGQWHQQSQENPVSLPLDKQTEETTLMALDVDLTDSRTQVPVLYAYLNDGSLQAWYLEHSKPYPRMVSLVSGTGASVRALNAENQDSAMDEKEAASVLSSISGFSQQPPTSPFGALGSNAAQQPSVFAPSPPATSVFGQTSQPSFGQTSAFGSLPSGSSPFGQPSTSQPSPPPFGSTSPGNAFAGIAAQRNNTNFFSTPSFGVATTSPSTQLAPPSDEMTREASMSDGTTPGFRGLSLGDSSSDVSDNKPKSNIFGSFGSAPEASQAPPTSAFGGFIKPAQGFGAFSNFGSGPSTSGSQATPTVSVFSSPPQTTTTHSTFGQTSFGAKSAFGQPSFGQTGFGQSAAPAAQTPGGFSAFATSSSAFGSTASAVSTAGGFSAFATGGTSPFGSSSKQTQQATTSSFSSSPFSSSPETAKSVFASGENKPSPFATGSDPAFGNANHAFTSSTSNFGLRGSTGESTTPQGSSVKGPPPGVVSPPSSPEPSGPGSPLDRKKTVVVPNVPAPGFLQQPSAGLGALGSLQESSPFFKKPETKSPIVTAFGNLSTAGAPRPPQLTTTATPSGFGTPSQLGLAKPPLASAPAFGATSQLGAAKSAFAPMATASTTPTKPPPTGAFSAFSAFSGSASGFSAFMEQKGSFSELLKAEDETQESEQSLLKGKRKEEVKEGPSTPSKPISVFVQLTPKATTNPLEATVSTTPKTPPPSVALKEESTTPKGPPPGEEHEVSLSTASLSSLGSFIDVAAEKSHEGAEGEEGEEGDDTRSFLSSDFSSGPPTDDEASDEEDETEGKGKAPVAPPQKKSPSPTPQPEVPSIEVIPSPPLEAPKASTAKEESTTPPGSPLREMKALSKSPSPTPASTPSTPSTPSSPSPSPLGIGLNRPSTRPARSSPLAGAPVSGADEEEESQVQTEKASWPPVGPKPILTQSLKNEDDASIAKRPGTPPLLSSFGKAPLTVPVAPKPELAQTQTPFALSAPSHLKQQTVPVFSKPAEPSVTAKQESPKPAAPSVFGGLPVKATFPSEVPKTAPVTPAGSPLPLTPLSLTPKPASAPLSGQASPGMTSPPAAVTPPVFAQAGPSMFSTPSKPLVQTGGKQIGTGLLGAKPSVEALNQTRPQVLPAKPAAPPPLPPLSVEEGLQKECTAVVKSIESELKELSELGTRVAQTRNQLTEALGGSRLKVDLGILEKWKVSDATTFGQTLLQFEKDLFEMADLQEAFRQTLRELNGSMLKANTRREEVARFNKAKTDKEFAKMLSMRALGPEHLESQQHLRRGIRSMRDRIQKLESHLQQSKKRLSQAASGKPSIRAPTLDVINRTYRNIDIAIQQQTDEIAKLADRVTELKFGSTEPSSPSRDARLPDQHRRSVPVMPQVAVTTAAALNAERSAHKLKKALLRARKEPILNQKAALAPPPPLEVETSQKPPPGSGLFSTVAGPLFSNPGVEVQTPIPDPNFSLPEDNFHPGSLLPSSRRGAGSVSKKHGSVPLKRTPGGIAQSPPSAAPASDFWGPLPVFNNPPLNKLAVEVTPTVSFTPLSPGPPMPTPLAMGGPTSSLPGGGFEAFIKPSS